MIFFVSLHIVEKKVINEIHKRIPCFMEVAIDNHVNSNINLIHASRYEWSQSRNHA